MPSKQPVVGSNPTGGVSQNQARACESQRSGSDGFPGQPISLHSFFSSLIGLEIRARALLAACSEQATFSGESSAVLLSH